MQEEYAKARRLGKREYARAMSAGRYPYLPALDDLLADQDTAGEYPVGMVEIPLYMIAGTKTAGRQKAFADDFMPLLTPYSEFGQKWSNLYDSQMEEGIRDPIKVYEYMHRFYVQEGNKRVSVSRYVGAFAILANVIRLLPKESDDMDYYLYREFLEFYEVAPIYEIDFSQLGSYKKLAELMKQDFSHPWPKELLERLKGGFQFFNKIYHDKYEDKLRINASDAFLIYLNFYHLDEMRGLTDAALIARINKLWSELLVQSGSNNVNVIDAPNEDGFYLKAQSVIRSMFQSTTTYDKEHPLRAAFCYERPQESSAWIYGHELGRNYVENKFQGVVETICFDDCSTDEKLRKAIDAAVADNCELIFTVSPKQMTETLRSAVHFPKVHFFNCSINLSHAKVRTYYARMFEAKAIIGALAASLSDNHKIGYIADYPIYGSVAEINAYAIGASMVDPNVKVYLAWSSVEGQDWKQIMRENKVSLVSGKDFIRPEAASREYGLFRYLPDDSIRNVAAPVWNWGKFYELIIQAFMDGKLDANPGNHAVNYWWGMSADVVDIILSQQLPYTSRKLVENLKSATMVGSLGPFQGELHDQKHRVIQGPGSNVLSGEEIITMNWLNENIIGRLPKLEELTPQGRETVAVSGIISTED